MMAHKVGRTRWWQAALVATAGGLAVAACSGSSSSGTPSPSADAVANSASGATALPPVGNLTVSHPTVWVCKPGMANNPCAGTLSTTVVSPSGGTTVKQVAPAADPKVDCFYVYPTISAAPTDVAPLTTSPAIEAVTKSQVGQFASLCRLYVPVYRQTTLTALAKAGTITPAARVLADADINSAWHDYLVHYNDGRGVLLLGHSQGSGQVIRLLSQEIEKSPAERARLIAAYIPGGNLLVPIGKDVGGDLKSTPLCRKDTQIGCVVAYSTFDETPPAVPSFGKTFDAFNSAIPAYARGELQVACVNPAALTGGTATLDAYIPNRQLATAALPGQPNTSELPDFQTDFTSYPGLVKGTCKYEDGTSWMMVDHPNGPGNTAPQIKATLGPAWGLHLYDMNLPQGNLLSLAAKQIAAW
jgi:hypothetical protein